eukprot:7061715-Pyramimonas_sp.AAC.1
MAMMKNGRLRAITHDVMGGVTRAGIRAPVLAAHSVHERLIGGPRQLHPERGRSRGEPASGRRSPR